ncbi:hypothetical protein OpiT1DRAFT_05584 [Opitutaceae bacterium TAV1]|nr:hypothetical protein OpiT1DRAFT_05584 [Opitutaceae bacterium TAV1]
MARASLPVSVASPTGSAGIHAGTVLMAPGGNGSRQDAGAPGGAGVPPASPPPPPKKKRKGGRPEDPPPFNQTCLI